MTSKASATSLDSTASTAIYREKTSYSWWFDHQSHQNDQLWNGSSKIKIFTDIWYHFCQSNFPTSGIYKYITSNEIYTCIFLSVRVNLKEIFQCETPCTYRKLDLVTTIWNQAILMINLTTHQVMGNRLFGILREKSGLWEIKIKTIHIGIHYSICCILKAIIWTSILDSIL